MHRLMDVLKSEYSAGKGNNHFIVGGCWLPLDCFSEQYQHEPSSDTHIVAMAKCTISEQNFLICTCAFKIIFHFEKLILSYIKQKQRELQGYI